MEPPAIPGFYYDAAKKRYFKITNGSLAQNSQYHNNSVQATKRRVEQDKKSQAQKKAANSRRNIDNNSFDVYKKNHVYHHSLDPLNMIAVRLGLRRLDRSSILRHRFPRLATVVSWNTSRTLRCWGLFGETTTHLVCSDGPSILFTQVTDLIRSPNGSFPILEAVPVARPHYVVADVQTCRDWIIVRFDHISPENSGLYYSLFKYRSLLENCDQVTFKRKPLSEWFAGQTYLRDGFLVSKGKRESVIIDLDLLNFEYKVPSLNKVEVARVNGKPVVFAATGGSLTVFSGSASSKFNFGETILGLIHHLQVVCVFGKTRMGLLDTVLVHTHFNFVEYANFNVGRPIVLAAENNFIVQRSSEEFQIVSCLEDKHEPLYASLGSGISRLVYAPVGNDSCFFRAQDGTLSLLM